ncbi:hypothetical protein Tco_1224978 [Tanacetum coccineum]
MYPLTSFLHTEMAEQEEVGEASARNASKKTSPAPAATPSPAVPEAETNAGGPEGSETDNVLDGLLLNHNLYVVMSRMFSGYQDA